MADSSSDTFWSFKEAKKKCGERYSCFVEIEVTEHMSLSPYYIGRIKQGVQEQIERKIRRWKFSQKHQGIIVAYDNIRLLQRAAEIYDESPFIHFDIKVNYIIFKPEIGQKLVGVVNKTSSTHVGCLVHGRFNASIAKPKLCQNGWVGARLGIGTEFIFRVANLQTVAGVLSIAGKIKDKDAKHFRFDQSSSAGKTTATNANMSVNTEHNHNHQTKKKKSKYSGCESCMVKNEVHTQPVDVSISNIEEDSERTKKKKSKQTCCETYDNEKKLSPVILIPSSLGEGGTGEKRKDRSKYIAPKNKLNELLKKEENDTNKNTDTLTEQSLPLVDSGSKRKLSDSPIKKHKHKRRKPVE